MKRIYLSLLFCLGVAMAYSQQPIKNYDFTFKISGLSAENDSVVYIANYYGSKQYYYDTILIAKGGLVRMSGDSIKGGIYSLITQDRSSYFEFVVNEPRIEMETKAGDFVQSMKVKTSDENIKFYEYLNFVNAKSAKLQTLKAKFDALEEGAEKEQIQEELSSIDKEVIAYKKQFIQDNPNLFISKVFAASAEPEIPEYTEIEDEDERNRKRYLEFKNQYLDGIDLSNEWLLRTPVYHNKLNYYITKLTPQVPDSVIKEADKLVALAKGQKECHKYIVHTITSKFEDSKIMGMDAVLVHMGQRYYCPDKAWWLKKEKLEEFCERVDAMAPLMIGKTATNLILQDTSGAWKSLYDVKTKYTLLYFWDSGCGHCKKMMPQLKEFYANYKEKGVEVFAVGTEFENEDWKKYIKKNDLLWINVSDTPESNENAHQLIREGKTTLESMNFRDTYDIFSTPKGFLLDENKKIIATKLTPEQMGEFIDNQLKEKATQP